MGDYPDHGASSSSALLTSWARPSSAHNLGVPKRFYYTASQSSFALQLKSEHTTSSAYSIPRTTSFRKPEVRGHTPRKTLKCLPPQVTEGCRAPSQGLEKYSKSTDNLYVGEAHQRHYIPATPGPGHYKHRTAVGKQVYSKNKQHGSHTFSKTDRFGYVDMANRKNATPGPGSYVA